MAAGRDAASGMAYSVFQGFPTDWSCAPEAIEEWNSMGEDLDAVEFSLSPEMERTTWNTSNWQEGTVTVAWDHVQSWNPVICDAEASAAIRTILDSRSYQAADVLPSADHVIYVDGVQYFIQSESGNLYRWDEGYGTTLATKPLTEAEVELLHAIVNNGGTMENEPMMEAMSAASAYFDREADTGMLFEYKMSYIKDIVSPDVDETMRQRANGTIGDSDWAFAVDIIFVPENPEDIQYLIAGNTHEYAGVLSSVPAGAYEMHRVGYAKRVVDAWEIQVGGTGW